MYIIYVLSVLVDIVHMIQFKERNTMRLFEIHLLLSGFTYTGKINVKLINGVNSKYPEVKSEYKYRRKVKYLINIDSRSSTPIYEQIIRGIKEDILKGILQKGDKLPSVREMASLISTNPNTVSKAYQELEREKVIETLRGKGTFVSPDYTPRLEEERMNKLREEIKRIIIEAHYLGIEKNDLINIMDEFYKEVQKDDRDK